MFLESQLRPPRLPLQPSRSRASSRPPQLFLLRSALNSTQHLSAKLKVRFLTFRVRSRQLSSQRSSSTMSLPGRTRRVRSLKRSSSPTRNLAATPIGARSRRSWGLVVPSRPWQAGRGLESRCESERRKEVSDLRFRDRKLTIAIPFAAAALQSSTSGSTPLGSESESLFAPSLLSCLYIAAVVRPGAEATFAASRDWNGGERLQPHTSPGLPPTGVLSSNLSTKRRAEASPQVHDGLPTLLRLPPSAPPSLPFNGSSKVLLSSTPVPADRSEYLSAPA